MEAREALRRVLFLRDADEQILHDLLTRARTINVGRGEVLFLRGEPCHGLYIVLQGAIRLYNSSSSGREQVIGVERSGSVIGELPLFDGGNQPCSAEAMAPSRLLFIPRDHFLNILHTHPELMQAALRALAIRVRRLLHLVEELSLHEVPERIARYLLAQAKERGACFTLDYTHAELAAQLGTVREVVTRTLNRFRKAGWIAVQNGQITVTDSEALQALACSED
ncbi:CRP-like cAMP-activated global transcriptional regulator [bacterium HR16]|nr:CRP-like cAMP-activated global transcriptional regulator [bacterium HR16]